MMDSSESSELEKKIESAAELSLRNWLERLDQWCHQVGDQLNPILVKETRQSLKSRQFIFTFFSLLAAALAWTVVGSLSRMPQIYSTPSAPNLLLGYYAVLAIPMLMVVPLAAYRSLEVEIDDGTFELLSISTLSPWQIVLGKLASSLLQILLYCVVLLPCMSYAYSLRGVDLIEMALIISAVLGSAALLTILAIFLAPLTRSRTGRTLTLLATVITLLSATAGISFWMSDLIQNGNPFLEKQLFLVVAVCVSNGIALGHLLLTATAAQLTPESENRSTAIRRSLLLLSSTIVFTSALAIVTENTYPSRPSSLFSRGEILYGTSIASWVLWTITGGMMVAESPILTPRVRRDLPGSIIGRTLSTWLTPGPVTGQMFVSINAVILVFWYGHGLKWLASQLLEINAYNAAARKIDNIYELNSTFAAYLIITLLLNRWLCSMIRRKQNIRVEVGIASLIAITLMMVLIPYSIGLHFNEFRPYSYSTWQISNWFWTLASISQGEEVGSAPLYVKSIACICLFGTLLFNAKLTQPRRTALPKRVAEENEKSRQPDG
ncbi:MAG: ABC transporter permease [Planctomycetota bacterium]|nr:ABC transporter permease [Planctomycetota bacterium]